MYLTYFLKNNGFKVVLSDVYLLCIIFSSKYTQYHCYLQSCQYYCSHKKDVVRGIKVIQNVLKASQRGGRREKECAFMWLTKNISTCVSFLSLRTATLSCSLYTFMDVCVYTHTYIYCMCVCMCIYLCTDTYTQRHKQTSLWFDSGRFLSDIYFWGHSRS